MSTLHAIYPLSPNTRLEIAQGDLTQETTDAIVNAANSRLAHGGGVAGAIAHAGGPSIQQESDAWLHLHGPVTHAEPAYTRAGTLACRYVIHAVGPVWGEGDEDKKLAEAISGSLRRAEELGLSSIAFPAISTGIFGFPKTRAARVFCQTLQDYFAGHPNTPLHLVRITLWMDEMVQIFLQAANKTFGEAAG